MWKWFFILMQTKLIFTRKVVHLVSFWKWGFLELGSVLLGANMFRTNAVNKKEKKNISFLAQYESECIGC